MFEDPINQAIQHKDAQAKQKEVKDKADAPLAPQDVQKKAADERNKAADVVAKLNAERIQAFRKAVPTFPEALAPALAHALESPLGLPSNPPDALHKLHEQLVPLQKQAHERAVVLLNPADPPPRPNAPQAEQKDFQQTLKDFQNILTRYDAARHAYEKARAPLVEERVRSFLIPDNRGNVTLTQFRDLLAGFSRTPPPPPDSPGNPVRAHFTTLTEPRQNYLRSLYSRLYGPPVSDAQVLKKDPQLVGNYNTINAYLRAYISGHANGQEAQLEANAAARLREAIFIFLLRRQEYDEAVRRPNEQPLHSLMGEWTFMMGVCIARGPLDHFLPGIPPEAWRPHAADVGQLNKQQLEALVKHQDRLRQTLIVRGYSAEAAARAVPNLTELNQILHDARIPSIARNFAMDCLRHNVLDGVLLVIYLHNSPDKVRAFGNWMAMMVMNASISAATSFLAPYIIQAAATSPACAALLLRTWRTAGPWVTIALAVTIMLLGHERVDRAIQQMDTFFFHTLGLPGRDLAAAVLSVPSDVLNASQDVAMDFGLSRVDPQIGFHEYITGSEAVFSLDRAYTRSTADWNKRVEQARKQRPNPLLSSLWALETIEGDGQQSSGNYARRRAADVLSRLPQLMDAERELNTYLGSSGLGIVPGGLNCVATAISDSPGNRRNDQVLYRQMVVSGEFLRINDELSDNEPPPAVPPADLALGGNAPAAPRGIGRMDQRLKDLAAKRKGEHAKKVEQAGKGGLGIEPPEPMPSAADLLALFRNYRTAVEQLAREMGVYRHMGIYGDNAGTAEWFGNNWATMRDRDSRYQMTQFVRDGMLLEIARNGQRRDALMFMRTGGHNPRQFARHLGDCLQHPAFDWGVSDITSPKVMHEANNKRIHESIRRSQLYKQITEMCSSVGDMFPDAGSSDGRCEQFNNALDPIRSLVLLFSSRGAPTLAEVEALHTAVRRIVDTLSKQFGQQAVFMADEDALGIQRFPCPMYRVGPANTQIDRAFGGFLDPTVQQVKKNSAGMYPFQNDLIVIHTESAGGQMSGRMISFNCPSPDRSTWTVLVHHAAQRFPNEQQIKKGNFFDPQNTSTLGFDIRAEQNETPFARWFESEAGLLRSLEPTLKSLENRIRDREGKEKAAEKKSIDAKLKLEQEEQRDLEQRVIRAETSTNRFLITRPTGSPPLTPVEYRMHHNGHTVIYSAHNYRSPYDNVTLWRLPITVSRDGGYARSPEMFNVTLQPDSSATVTFQFRNPDGTQARGNISVASYQAYLAMSDVDKDLFRRLLVTPMENNVQSLYRIVRLFPHRYMHHNWTDSTRYMCNEMLVERLLPLYETSGSKLLFLGDLFRRLAAMNQSTGLDRSAVDAIVQFFEKNVAGNTYGNRDLPSMEPIYGSSGVQFQGVNMLLVGYRHRPGQPRSFDYFSRPGDGSDIEGYLSRNAQEQWREPFAMLDSLNMEVLRTAPVMPEGLDFPDHDPAFSSVTGRSIYGVLGLMFNASRKQFPDLQRRGFLLEDPARDIFDRVLVECRQNPPRLSPDIRKRAEQHLKLVEELRRDCFRAQRRMQLAPVVREAVRGRIQAIDKLHAQGISMQERYRYADYNPAEAKLITALNEPSLSGHTLLLEAIAISIRGEAVPAGITAILANHEKQYAEYLKRADEYRKGREQRFKVSADIRQAVQKENPTPASYRGLIADEEAHVLAGESHRPALLWRGDRNPQDLNAYRDAIPHIRDLQTNTLPWSRLRAVIMDVTGSGDSKRYMFTLCYTSPGAGNTRINIPAAGFTLQFTANWNGTPPQLAFGPTEMLLREHQSDPYPQIAVDAAQTFFEIQQVMDVQRLGLAPNQGGMSSAESFARLFGPGNTMRMTRLPGQDQTVMAFIRNGRQYLVRRNPATQEWEFRVTPLPIAKAGHTVPGQAHTTAVREKIGQELIDTIVKSGGNFDTGWQSVSGTMQRISQVRDGNTQGDLSTWADLQAMSAGSLENNFSTQTAGMFLAVHDRLVPQGHSPQLEAAMEQALNTFQGNPALQSQLMEQMQKFFTERGNRTLSETQVSMLGQQLRGIGQRVQQGSAGPFLPSRVFSVQ